MSAKSKVGLLVEDGLKKETESELSEAQRTLLGLCRLIVDIEYRRRYGTNVDGDEVNEYSEVTIQ